MAVLLEVAAPEFQLDADPFPAFIYLSPGDAIRVSGANFLDNEAQFIAHLGKQTDDAHFIHGSVDESAEVNHIADNARFAHKDIPLTASSFARFSGRGTDTA